MRPPLRPLALQMPLAASRPSSLAAHVGARVARPRLSLVLVLPDSRHIRLVTALTAYAASPSPVAAKDRPISQPLPAVARRIAVRRRELIRT